MDETAIIVAVIVVAAVVVVAAVAWWFVRRRSRGLHERFGPEYDRTLEHADSRREAEEELRERERRREELDIVPLDDEARARYAEEWLGVQQRFVDAPAQSLAEADVLVVQVMRDRGYPVDDFERRAADVSVDHPDVASHYRAGHAITERSHLGECDTEELREGVQHYRALFEDLLEDRHEDDYEERGPRLAS
jgi:hypothetical protein